MLRDIDVSVVIPVYNVSKFLRECLDSVLIQSLKNIEVICINDGSTDNSLDILQEYACKDSRIVVIDQKNMGVGKTRNVGINVARGKYIVFLDPDDFYPSQNLLEILHANIIKHNVDICGGCFAEYRNGKYKTSFDREGLLWGYVFEKEGLIRYSDWQFEYGYHRFLYRTEFLRKNEIYYPPLIRFQDPPFLVHAMICAKEFYALTDLTYAIRCGHQKINWTTEKVADLLRGLLYNLKISRKYNLSKLHYMTYRRLTEEFYSHVKKQVCHFSVAYLLLCFYVNISYKLMYEENKDFKNKMWSFFVKNYAESIFSVKNTSNKRHKVISVLGFKFKFRRKVVDAR